MKFSVCIPNYNYEAYIGQTIESVLGQDDVDLEICVSDNASTDRSLEVVNGFQDNRIRVQQNAVNMGFARNLDCAASMAIGDYIIMLSSDDLMAPGALARYRALLGELGKHHLGPIVISSALEVIDSDGQLIGESSSDRRLWGGNPSSSQQCISGASVTIENGHELLRRCLDCMANPFNFCTLAYPRELWTRVGGYGGQRLINPDKWFNWNILAAGPVAVSVAEPLFRYRWHQGNQSAQQKRSGALKYLVDEYVSTFQLDGRVLDAAGIGRPALERAFVRADIGRHGLSSIGRDGWLRGFRIWAFGLSVYPSRALTSVWWWLLSGALAAGPVGWAVSRWRHSRVPSFGRR